MSEIRQHSAVLDYPQTFETSSQGAQVTLRERRFLGHIMLRGKSDDHAFLDGVRSVLGVDLPTTPNTQVSSAEFIVCWVRPDAWLLLSSGDTCSNWIQQLRTALADTHAAVIDLSGAQALFEIRGERALDTLAKGTTLDLHPRALGADQCTYTLLAHAGVLVRVVEPGQAFDLIIKRSYAQHLWHWLLDCAHEYGCTILPSQTILHPDER